MYISRYDIRCWQRRNKDAWHVSWRRTKGITMESSLILILIPSNTHTTSQLQLRVENCLLPCIMLAQRLWLLFLRISNTFLQLSSSHQSQCQAIVHELPYQFPQPDFSVVHNSYEIRDSETRQRFVYTKKLTVSCKSFLIFKIQSPNRKNKLFLIPHKKVTNIY